MPPVAENFAKNGFKNDEPANIRIGIDESCDAVTILHLTPTIFKSIQN